MTPCRYRIEHETTYAHAGRASTSQHIACLKPRTLPRQIVHRHDLAIEPAPDALHERIDYFGNHVHRFEILSPYVELRVTSRSLVDVSPRWAPVDPEAGTAWEVVRGLAAFHVGRPADRDVQFRYPSPYVVVEGELAAYAGPSFPARRPVLAAAADLMHRIHCEFRFDPGATTITTPVARVLVDRHGVCQDFAHLMIGCLRALGLPARYVSGYLLTDPPPGQARLVGADASHAWVSVHDPAFGWVDFDPTNDVLPDARHIVTAWGRDYGDVSPLRGVVLGGRQQTLAVGVSVIPVREPPGAPIA